MTIHLRVTQKYRRNGQISSDLKENIAPPKPKAEVSHIFMSR